MKIDKNTNILIVGLGLIGGTYAKALKAQGYRVSAITKEQSSVDFAMSHGYVDFATTEIDENLISKADLIVLALYPHILIDWVKENGRYIKEGAIVTDVTGIKECIVAPVQEMLGDRAEFIAAHPMAGRERSGVENSDETVFKDANYVVTPSEKNTQNGIETCKQLGRILGFSRISELSVKRHDEIIGFVSQLTHCIAICLMTCQTTEHLEDYTGDSFRDLTRIARLNDEMWSELFLLNREALISRMDLYMNEMKRLRSYLESGDRESLREMMRYSTARRALFDKKPK
ncbi:MAG: prephenate dehydrogenase [Eubacteriales bacterium]|nr:prephenate dehydrogenase [Eubacteriales bacterium]